MSIKCPSSSILITFGWKSIKFNIRMATPACFLGSFAWKIVFQPFTLRWCLSLSLMYASCMQQNAVSCFHIHSVSLCIFHEKLSPLMKGDIKDQWLFLLVICVDRDGIMSVWLLLSSFLFIVWWLISCFFSGVVSLLVLEFPVYYPV